MTDKTIRELQTSLPWTIRYSRDFRANPQPHKDFTHALLHVTKALGKLQGLCDDMDHDPEVADNPKLREEYGKYVADLVVCAIRAANVFPGGVLDLQSVTQKRIEVKNKLPVPPIERTLGGNPYESHKFHLVEAMKDDQLLGCVPVVSNWHHCQIMEAVEALYPECTGFRDKLLPATPVWVPVDIKDVDMKVMNRQPIKDEMTSTDRDKWDIKSQHYKALNANRVCIGTFWAKPAEATDIGLQLYPGTAYIETDTPSVERMPF